MIGGGGGGGGGEAEVVLPPGMSAYSLEEVAKHTSKTDCWVVVDGKVMNVTSFLKDHPGGELAILTFAGKDATEEFNMIHPPDVIGKYAPQAVIGIVGVKAAAAAPAAASGGVKAVKVATKADKGHMIANHHYWGDHEGTNYLTQARDEGPGALIINFENYFMAGWYLMLAVLYEVCATIFTAKNFKITNDRVGLTRSAILLILFIVIHAVGNLHVFMGPDDFNGYGYFYVRLYWTGFGLPANIVEEYIALSVLLHVGVALKRTWDQKLKMGIASGALNLAITGLALLTFMTIHLVQFRFGDTDQFGPYMVCTPPYLINILTVLDLELNLFWMPGGCQNPVGVRDIYALEYQLFQNKIWSAFYICSVLIFVTHACLGWKKCVPVLGIPKLHQPKVDIIGYIIMFVLGAIYISFPVFCLMVDPVKGGEPQLQIPADRVGM